MVKPCVIRLAHAIVDNAFNVAEMVAHLLAQMSTVRKSYPKPFLMELGAICQIKIWEDAGLLPHLSTKLPNYSTAIASFTNRLRTSRNPYPSGTKKIALVDKVECAKAETYFTFRLAAHYPNCLTSIKLTEEQLSKIADFLWDLRHLVIK